MSRFRPTRASTALSDYWNALQSGTQADELARLADLVEPSEREAIQRVRAMHQPHVPDPQFALRLERILMNAAAHPASQAVPLPRIPTRRAPAATHPGGTRPAMPPRALVHYGSIALRVALVLLLAFLTASGIWLFTRHDGNQQIATPPVATPTVNASPDVPMYRGNAARTGVFPGPALVGSPVELWQVQIGDSLTSTPALANGVLYIGAGGKGILAIDSQTGDTLWSYPANAPVPSSPAVADGIVYAVQEDGLLLVLDAKTGTERWTMPGIRPGANPLVDGGVVYMEGDSGAFYALDATTGSAIWTATMTEPVWKSATIADGRIYVGTHDGVVHTLNADNGDEIWTYTLDHPESGVTINTVAAGHGRVYIGTNNPASTTTFGQTIALDATTGKHIWSIDAGPDSGFGPPVVGASLVYASGNDGVLSALDPATGETRWTYDVGDRFDAAPALVDDTLYIGSADGRLIALDAKSGTETWTMSLDGGIKTGPTVSGGVAYVGTIFGNLYAITGSGMLAARDLSTPSSRGGAVPMTTPAATPAQSTGATEVWSLTQGGSEPLFHPSAVRISPDGMIWVPNGRTSQYQIFTPDGAFIETWGKPGNGPGQFNFLRNNSGGDTFGAVAFAPDDTFYVADLGNHRIQHFAADRTYLGEWGSFGANDGQFISPIDIAVDSHGNVFVVDDKRNDIQKFDAGGKHLATFGGYGHGPGQLDFPGFMALDRDGNVWVADGENGRIEQWTNEGVFVREVTLDEITMIPVALAFDRDQRLYVTGTNSRIVVLDPALSVVSSWDLTTAHGAPLTTPSGIQVDDEGAVYIADFLSGTLIKYTLPIATPTSQGNASPVATPAT
ncbi:MAG: PQQ-binding-like beta-propeller repeat protein [Thermomicrobiales bacterium]